MLVAQVVQAVLGMIAILKELGVLDDEDERVIVQRIHSGEAKVDAKTATGGPPEPPPSPPGH